MFQKAMKLGIIDVETLMLTYKIVQLYQTFIYSYMVILNVKL